MKLSYEREKIKGREISSEESIPVSIRINSSYPFAGEFWIFNPVAFTSPVSANHWLGKPHQIYIDIVTDPF